MTFGIFEEIDRLVEYIPIENDTTIFDGKLTEGISLDSQFYFEDIDGVATRLGVLEVGRNMVSLRDIIKLLNKFRKDARIEEIIESRHRYRQVQSSGSGLPLRNLLFDFCLAALTGDKSDAKLYLTHTFYLLGLRRRLALLLSILINEPPSLSLANNDNDVRELLTLLATISEPNNIDIYFDQYGDGFDPRYSTYLYELQKLSKPMRLIKRTMINNGTATDTTYSKIKEIGTNIER